MRPSKLLLLLAPLLFTACSSPNDNRSVSDQYDGGATGVAIYGPIDDVKRKYVQAIDTGIKTEKLFDGEQLREGITKFNSGLAGELKSDADPIDAFVATLPSNYRRHFTLVHRSFSIQKASPMSPRVLMFGPNARVVMTFNAGVDVDGKAMDGGQTIEVMEYKTDQKIWSFSEITFDASKRITLHENPAKCAMCHSGTPKTVELGQAHFYQKNLKPIFPQYPFWPGFYGSVNDIVGWEGPGSRDSIMRNLKDTVQHIKSLTFDSTEELFRLRKLLDENPKYLKVVENELDVHQKYFHKFMSGMKSRDRYRHLLTLKDLYSSKEKVPETLNSAPYRRTFDHEYGHYLQRPNFLLSSMLSFYHSEYVANEISKFPAYNQFKYSLLARKYNCGDVQAGNLSLKDLDSSFDLVYPNIVKPANRDRQYLLAYQYNLVRAAQNGPPALPLHAWNLESNEDIASYHYGNVFADLNELVLWKLTSKAFPQIKLSSGRSAAQDRHFELPGSTFLKEMLEVQALGVVSKFTQQQMNFATSPQSYYGQAAKLQAQPVSNLCASVYVPAAKQELMELSKLQTLPHDIFSLSPKLIPEKEVIGNFEPSTMMARQSCEACHSDVSVAPADQIKTGFNVDWYSDSYPMDLRRLLAPALGAAEQSHAAVIHQAISSENLPVPFGNQMPFGRKPLDPLSLECEKMIVDNSFRSEVPLKSKPFQCQAQVPDSMACRCQKIMELKSKVYRELYPKTAVGETH